MSQRKTIPIEEKQQIVKFYLEQCRITEISKIMNLRVQTISRIVNQYLKDGEVRDNSNKKGGPHPKKLTEEQQQTLNNWMDEDCSLSLRQISQKCKKEFGVNVCPSTIRNYLSNFNYTFKRTHSVPVLRNAPENIAARKEYALRFNDWLRECGDANFMFVGEVSFTISLRCKGTSVTTGYQSVPCVRKRIVTICCAMTKNGIIAYESVDGAFNEKLSSKFATKLKNSMQANNIANPIVIVDVEMFRNIGVFKKFAAENELRLEYLPPDSPILNPIEHLFAKWTEIVKRAAPSKESELMDAINDGSLLVTPKDCEEYFNEMLKYISKCNKGEKIVE